MDIRGIHSRQDTGPYSVLSIPSTCLYELVTDELNALFEMSITCILRERTGHGTLSLDELGRESILLIQYKHESSMSIELTFHQLLEEGQGLVHGIRRRILVQEEVVVGQGDHVQESVHGQRRRGPLSSVLTTSSHLCETKSRRVRVQGGGGSGRHTKEEDLVEGRDPGGRRRDGSGRAACPGCPKCLDCSRRTGRGRRARADEGNEHLEGKSQSDGRVS